MDILLTQGFLHLAEDIFERLDNVSLGRARRVCKQWKWVIEEQKYYWQRIVQSAKNKSTRKQISKVSNKETIFSQTK